MKFIFDATVSCALAAAIFAATGPAPLKEQAIMTNQAGMEVAAGTSRTGTATVRDRPAPRGNDGQWIKGGGKSTYCG